MIFLRTAASVMPMYGFMLLFGMTASGFAMKFSSVASSQVIPELLRPCD